MKKREKKYSVTLRQSEFFDVEVNARNKTEAGKKAAKYLASLGEADQGDYSFSHEGFDVMKVAEVKQ